MTLALGAIMDIVKLQNFRGINQAQSQWCWAAAAASIYNYYGSHATPARTSQPQCAFVQDQIKVCGCLRGLRNGSCFKKRCWNPAANLPEHLNLELTRWGLLEFPINCDGTEQRFGDRVFSGGFDWHEVAAYIDAGRPIGLRVMVSMDLTGSASHFLIIVGYHRRPAERMVIWDPYYGERHLTLEELNSLYGPLEQKYLTKQAPAAERFDMKNPGRTPSHL
jgi:Papain-like cysteine protease AvrRpt2